MSQRQAEERKDDFEEVELGFTAKQAITEAQRCIQCRSCAECRLCEGVCDEIEAIDHFRPSRLMTITSPTVIVASDEEVAHLDLADEEDVYRVGDLRRATNLVNVLIAGSASAGQVMAECAPLRITGFRKGPCLLSVTANCGLASSSAPAIQPWRHRALLSESERWQ